MTEQRLAQGSFEEWPLHDAVIGRLEVDWEQRVARLDLDLVISPNENGRRAVLEWQGVTRVELTRTEEWGPSSSVNSLRREREGEYVVEVQSGDEIRVTADSASLERKNAA
jgi:hypothetical protein